MCWAVVYPIDLSSGIYLDENGKECHGASCAATTNPSWIGGLTNPTSNCKEFSAYCFSSAHSAVASCTSCKPGYELKEERASVACPGASEIIGNTATYDYTYCYQNCNSTTCVSSGWYSTGQDGYESRIKRSCSVTGPTGKCNETTEYRCAPGYYGTPNSTGTSGCNRCPEASDIWTDSAHTIRARGISAAGSNERESCHLESGIDYYDDTGRFQVKAGAFCHY